MWAPFSNPVHTLTHKTRCLVCSMGMFRKKLILTFMLWCVFYPTEVLKCETLNAQKKKQLLWKTMILVWNGWIFQVKRVENYKERFMVCVTLCQQRKSGFFYTFKSWHMKMNLDLCFVIKMNQKKNNVKSMQILNLYWQDWQDLRTVCMFCVYKGWIKLNFSILLSSFNLF